ncbi:formyltransferase family protein [Methylotenera sp. N17]|uniref:formyltransferase family protein n=1 Tax=Methylotenera sp. N17 TaxID=1502761 RepID=UPI0006902563|nr:formyltransferase family protein [Methylotenera sp. N17]
MKLALFADNKVGLEVLNYLISFFPEDLHTVIATSSETPVYTMAQSKSIQTRVFNKDLGEFSLEENYYDLGILAWWPNIIKEPIISAPKLGFINFHPSYLPFNRGKHYNFWALVEQCPFGVSLHKVDNGIDTGNIVSQKLIDYDWEDNGETLYNKAQEEIVSLFKATYPAIRNGNFNAVPQDLALGSFHLASELDNASKINLDDQYTARELLNTLRARTFKGHPSCWFEEADGKKYEVRIQINKA